MEATISETAECLRLSPLDQIMPRVYSRIVLPLPLKDTELQSPIQHLRQGFKATVTEISFLKGVVVPSTLSRGRVEVICRRDIDWPTIWKIKNLATTDSEQVIDIADLREKRFPISQLPDDILAPVPTFPESSKPAPVVAAQVNMIKGGLLLCVAFHHAVLDAAGFATVIKRWSSHCTRDDHLEALGAGVFDREPLISGLPPGDPGEFKEYTVPISSEDQLNRDEAVSMLPSSPLPKMKTVILHFESGSLKRLKEDIVSSATDLDPLSVVSTNDCLCALLWWYITCARFPSRSASLSDDISKAENLPHETSLGFAINGRSRCDPPLPEEYLGNVNLYGKPSFPLSRLADSSVTTTTHLAALARLIRLGILSINGERIKRVIGLVNSLPDPSQLTPGFQNFLGPDLAITSWATLGLHGLRFFEEQSVENASEAGKETVNTPLTAFGCVEAVRIPEATFDGLCVILPRLEDGLNGNKSSGLEVIIGLQEEVMERLIDTKSGMWQYATSIIV